MPELVDDKKVFTLQEVALSIRKTIADRYTSTYWIKAEINKLNVYAKSGHCFPELVDKKDGVVEAEMRATIWKADFQRINKNFQAVLKEPLKDGIKVLIQASISYEPKYGLSLIIRDIDPNYSLGELEREKKETIDKLHAQKLFGKNKLLTLAKLPQRIAIISIETSKGYSDFIKVIDQNIFGYRFFHLLFPAVLQGPASIVSIKRQLSRIKKVKKHFDAVAIIRGGGADVGLSSFNDYQLSKAICEFPLPVFTGIGHSTNLTVCEMVAYQNAITPTELGDFFLQKFHDFAVPVQRAQDIILTETQHFLGDEHTKFKSIIHLFKTYTRNHLRNQHHEIRHLSSEVIQETKFKLSREKVVLHNLGRDVHKSSRQLINNKNVELIHDLANIEKNSKRFLKDESLKINSLENVIRLVDPIAVLKRGYTLSTINGKSITNFDAVQTGDIISTFTKDGEIESSVTKKIKK